MPAELYQYKFPSPRWGWREGLILHSNGGWGEIAPLPGFSSETLEEARGEIIELLPRLREARPKFPSVRFGLSSAARPLDLSPLRIPLCALNRPRPGFAALKLKLGHLSVEEAIRTARANLGKFRLRIDCNRLWNLDQALQFAAAFQPDDFEYLEEPVDTFENLLRFSEITGFPLAVDESIRCTSPFQIPTLKALVVKPTVLGCIPPARPGVEIILSSAYETHLGLLQIARLASPCGPAHGLDTLQPLDTLLPPLRIEGGFLLWEPKNRDPINRDALCLIASAP